MAEKRERKAKPTAYFDYNLVFILIFLICFGLLMLYSSSSYIAAKEHEDGMYY